MFAFERNRLYIKEDRQFIVNKLKIAGAGQ
jgi:hypothetical protein